MWHEDTFSQRYKTIKEQGRVGGGGQNLRKGGGGGGKEYSGVFIK